MNSPAPRDFGKVAVLMGGRSAERDISLRSGGAVLAALRRQGVDAHGVDAGADVVARLQAGGFARAFIALHGRGGEDGVIQGALETMGLPYTGSGVLASALSMDKLRSKRVWQGAGLPTPPCRPVTREEDLDAAMEAVGLPLIVKPVHEGSSLGMTKVYSWEALPEAWRAARAYDADVLVEQWIDGREYTVAVIGDRALPLIAISTGREFYDYTAKYDDDSTLFECPCGLPAAREAVLQALALEAFAALGCRGWGRVDLICDEDDEPWLIEVNTVPGMTDHSLVPMAARAAGLSFDEVVMEVLATSLHESGT